MGPVPWWQSHSRRGAGVFESHDWLSRPRWCLLHSHGWRLCWAVAGRSWSGNALFFIESSPVARQGFLAARHSQAGRLLTWWLAYPRGNIPRKPKQKLLRCSFGSHAPFHPISPVRSEFRGSAQTYGQGTTRGHEH